MRFIFVVEMTTAPSGGTAPPARPVPDPRATNGTPWRTAMATHAWTSSVDSGKHTATAPPSMPDASWRYSDSSVAPSRTRSGERARRRSSISERVPTPDRRGAAAVIPVRWARAGASG